MTSTPGVAPLRYCRRCEADHPESECRVVAAGSGKLLVCPVCGMVTGEVVRRVERPLRGELIEALRWPAKGDNVATWLALGIGVAVFARVPLVGGLLSLGALWSYLFVVIQRGARGEEQAPAAADFQTWWDIVLPVLQGFTALAIPSLPLVAALFVSGPLQVVLAVFGVLWAVALLPAAVASTAYGGSFSRALNPLPMIALVGRIPREYALTVALLGALALAWLCARGITMGVVGLLGRPLPVLALPLGFAAEAAMVYFPLAMARVMAVLLRERAEELGIERLPDLSTR